MNESNMKNLENELLQELLKYANNVLIKDLPNELKTKVCKWYLKFADAETEPYEDQEYLKEKVVEYTVDDIVELINM